MNLPFKHDQFWFTTMSRMEVGQGWSQGAGHPHVLAQDLVDGSSFDTFHDVLNQLPADVVNTVQQRQNP